MYNQEGTPMTEPAIGRDYPEPAIREELHRVPEPLPELSAKKPLTKQQLLQEYEIRIEFLDRGCIVRIGCKSIAFSTVSEAMEAVNSYVNNPKPVGEYWRGQFNM